MEILTLIFILELTQVIHSLIVVHSQKKIYANQIHVEQMQSVLLAMTEQIMNVQFVLAHQDILETLLPAALE
jgi:hypothetical protein